MGPSFLSLCPRSRRGFRTALSLVRFCRGPWIRAPCLFRALYPIHRLAVQPHSRPFHALPSVFKATHGWLRCRRTCSRPTANAKGLTYSRTGEHVAWATPATYVGPWQS